MGQLTAPPLWTQPRTWAGSDPVVLPSWLLGKARVPPLNLSVRRCCHAPRGAPLLAATALATAYRYRVLTSADTQEIGGSYTWLLFFWWCENIRQLSMQNGISASDEAASGPPPLAEQDHGSKVCIWERLRMLWKLSCEMPFLLVPMFGHHGIRTDDEMGWTHCFLRVHLVWRLFMRCEDISKFSLHGNWLPAKRISPS